MKRTVFVKLSVFAGLSAVTHVQNTVLRVRLRKSCVADRRLVNHIDIGFFVTPCVFSIFAEVIRINIAGCFAARTVDHGVNVAPRKNVVFIGKRTVFFDGRVPAVAVGNDSILGCCVNSLGTGVDAVGFGIIIKFPAVAVEPERIFDFGFRHVIHGKRRRCTGQGIQTRTPLGAADQMNGFRYDGIIL